MKIRDSKNDGKRKVNSNNRKLAEFIKENNQEIFNGNIKRNEKRKQTFTRGKGNTVTCNKLRNRRRKNKE